MTSSKYHSWAEVRAHLHTDIEKTVTDLHTIWQQMGITDDSLHKRRVAIREHVANLLQHVKEEEEKSLEQKLQRVSQLRQKLHRVCDDLKVSYSSYEPPCDANLLETERVLQHNIDGLADIRAARMQSLDRLTEQDRILAATLGISPHWQRGDEVPSESDLDAFERKIIQLTAERGVRLTEYRRLATEIGNLVSVLACDAEPAFDVRSPEPRSLSQSYLCGLRDYVKRLETTVEDRKEHVAALTSRLRVLWAGLRLPITEDYRTAFMKTIQGLSVAVVNSLKGEIERCEQLRRSHLKEIVTETRSRLLEQCERVYLSLHETQAFDYLFTGEPTETVLSELDGEIARLEAFHKQAAPVFEGVEQWMVMWKRFIELEHRNNDPSRLLNRGGTLLMEQKEFDRVKKELPKVQARVEQEIAQWQSANGRPLTICGAAFSALVDARLDEHLQEKENQKQLRQQAKKEEIENEMLYGAKKRKNGAIDVTGVPKTPLGVQQAKRAKLGEMGRTPNSTTTRPTTPCTPRVAGLSSRTPLLPPSSAASRPNFSALYSSPYSTASRVQVATASSSSKNRRRSQRRSAKYAKMVAANKQQRAAKTGGGVVVMGRENNANHTLLSMDQEDVIAPLSSTHNHSPTPSIASVGPFSEFTQGLNPDFRISSSSTMMH